MLRLVTHNGRPRAEGGLMVGYLFERANGTRSAWPPTLAAAIFPPPRVDPKRRNSELPRRTAFMDNRQIRCEGPGCGQINGGPSKSVPFGDFSCRECGQPMYVC
ncbi:MAG: hypothetical protein A3J07_02365 [Candidatus Doudnabacteria bacterium RIFCSPLOWO2_02_FULL_49_13]|uniref:Uncharacterized protein n=1 Tax=Candidatus Doudnabacteria bacterium RIFCSPHIGHO2_12_FULL_48_16 TaxID=1817838 RepID=A0A1F5PLU3_9BACT|nr:MAG: hypothetical protein A3B77_00350 [Candidatus Doudnabacteria bacterium RIFCSPHIGHO2_02_FULL_49_24]OGE89505.1 MAG: hypothetical protein A2760_02650 [Candidatus Doudnabacteria bacterium RIFCSPHIGHO2_01_FULL_50_67]OGE90774.1 MAG: hypothetical protein A3E29_01465 [Candidatus Doudnabacteria bacterium RIFCSPHIGHO2_12_FULL_48_16]OGE97407.1 MAG: hypothetical protein A2990_01285 [Candidatus Doudnabacteria bacterium RIFCSPLOWO2_01_FULL_49_40]OGF02636.1 MAG: hypothetical protein A3J07_02365 [Candid